MEYEKKYNDALDWMRQIYPTLSGCAKEDAEHYFPELKESEDERIRKELIGHCQDLVRMNKGDKVLLSIYEPWIAYLEKQKEKMTAEEYENSELFQLKLKTKYADGYQDALAQKEQKPNVELIQKSWYMEGYHDGKYNNEPKWLIQTGKGGPKYEENPKYETQKPVEWSEEDKYILKNIHDFIKENTINPNRVNCAEECLIWLNSLPERFNLQPKQEWSKEDEKMRQHIISDLREFRDCETDEELISDYEYEIAWLKSLRPQNHWKPSKEQMEALNKVVNGEVLLTTQHKSLKSLLDYLEKL